MNNKKKQTEEREGERARNEHLLRKSYNRHVWDYAGKFAKLHKNVIRKKTLKNFKVAILQTFLITFQNREESHLKTG